MIVERRQQRRLPGSYLMSRDENGTMRRWETGAVPSDPGGMHMLVQYPSDSATSRLLAMRGEDPVLYQGDRPPLPMRYERREGAVAPASSLAPGEWSVELPYPQVLSRVAAPAAREPVPAAVSRSVAPGPALDGGPVAESMEPFLDNRTGLLDNIPEFPAYVDAEAFPDQFRMGDPNPPLGDGRDLDGDGVPDVVTRTVTRQLDDGATERTVEKYTGRRPPAAVANAGNQMRAPELASADRGMTDRLLAGDLSATDAQYVRRGLSPQNRDTGMRRAAGQALDPARTAQARGDRLSEAESGRKLALDVAKTQAAGQALTAREAAKGVSSRAALDAESRGIKTGMEEANRLRDDRRAEALSKQQGDAAAAAVEDRAEKRKWLADLRERARVEMEAGKAAGTEGKFTEGPDGQTLFHPWGAYNEDTGAPIWQKLAMPDGATVVLKKAQEERAAAAQKKEQGQYDRAVSRNGRRWGLKKGADEKRKESWVDLGPA